MNATETIILISAILTFMWAWTFIFDLPALAGAVLAIPATLAIFTIAAPLAAIAAIIGAAWACWWILTTFGPVGIITIAGLIAAAFAAVTIGIILAVIVIVGVATIGGALIFRF